METTSEYRIGAESGALALDTQSEGDVRDRTRAAGAHQHEAISPGAFGEHVPVWTPSVKRQENELISISLGHQNGSGDWIKGDKVEIRAIPTACPQIFITNAVDGHLKSLVLTHYQSGFSLAHGLPNQEAARYVAAALAGMLPVSDWDVMGEAERRFSRARVANLVKQLPRELQIWLRGWNHSKKGTRTNGNKDHEKTS